MCNEWTQHCDLSLVGWKRNLETILQNKSLIHWPILGEADGQNSVNKPGLNL